MMGKTSLFGPASIVLLTGKRFYILIIVALTAFSCTPAEKTPTADRGLLNLTAWDFETNGNVSLDGEWEFYWNKLLGYNELQGRTPDLYGKVPDIWNRYNINGKDIPGKGYATYRLHVRTGLPADTQMSLSISHFSNAYRLFIDEKPVASRGRVAKTPSEEKGGYRSRIVVFNIPSADFDIIIHVSNLYFPIGGFWKPVLLGSVEGINHMQDSIIQTEFFLFGGLSTLCVFFITIFLLNRTAWTSLYLALICMSLIPLMDILRHIFILKFFPGMSIEAICILLFSSENWGVHLLTLYVHETFKIRFFDKLVKLSLVISCLLQVLFILIIHDVISKFSVLIVCYYCILFLSILLMCVMAVKNDQKIGWLYLGSVLLLFFSYIYEYLCWFNLIPRYFYDLFFLIVFFFFFIQIIIQAWRQQQYLEDKTTAQLNFLQAQIKPHFLYNTLNTCISISRFDMDKTRYLLMEFSDYLRHTFLFNTSDHFLSLAKEIELSKNYLNIEKTRFEDRLEAGFDVSVTDALNRKVPVLILQPIVENAVLHGILPRQEGGCVHVSVKEESGRIVFRVKDNGVGFVREPAAVLSEKEVNGSVGLANIDSRLKKLYGKGLQVISSPQAGTTVTWNIPIRNKERRK